MRTLYVNWKALDGAAQAKRKLILRANDEGTFTCPITLCLHTNFKSARGLRKHIDKKHFWYYYFEKQPEVKREELEEVQPLQQRASTKTKPHYTIENGIGKIFLDWLSTTCGGGKSERESKQIAKRAMKFLMESTGENEYDFPLNYELLDCCLGSPQIIIRFLTVLEKDWKLSFSSMLSYVKSISDLLDFRKSEGVSDDNLRSFTVSEVYLRRARENLSKKKHLECTRNFDLETLIARDSWATIEEMEKVIPFHIAKYKVIVEKCKGQSPLPTKQELVFCTRFIAVLLFLRVKCSRPMTFRYLTLEMIDSAQNNGGFIDQTKFKTADKYMFDTLIISTDVLVIIKSYITYPRKLLNPKTNYLLVSTTGFAFQSLSTAMTMLVHAAIGKHINPTRYRQIVETTSADRLSREDQETISEDQKHSSIVAKVYYKKKQSRQVAIEGKRCMEKLVGHTRMQTDIDVQRIVSGLDETFDQSVLDKAAEIIGAPSQSPFLCLEQTEETQTVDMSAQEIESTETANDNPYLPVDEEKEGNQSNDDEICITNTVYQVIDENNEEEPMATDHIRDQISESVEVKKETAHKHVKRQGNSYTKFSREEDDYLRKGITKYGRRNWSNILKDKQYKFHNSRTRDSLRVRADSAKFKKYLSTL